MNESFFILISILLGLILLTAFYVLPNYQIAKAQTQSGSNKSIWQRLQANITSHPALGRNADGRLEVFARGVNNHLYHMSQTKPNGGFDGNWSSLKGALASHPVVGRNADDRLEVFAVGTDNH